MLEIRYKLSRFPSVNGGLRSSRKDREVGLRELEDLRSDMVDGVHGDA